MKRKVIFLEDFATFKNGDEKEFESAHASRLVHRSKVAKYTDAPAEPKTENAGDDSITDVVTESVDKVKKFFGKGKNK